MTQQQNSFAKLPLSTTSPKRLKRLLVQTGFDLVKCKRVPSTREEGGFCASLQVGTEIAVNELNLWGVGRSELTDSSCLTRNCEMD
jgi:hypothetical protein